jgi:D-amino-acid dehydrogenase
VTHQLVDAQTCRGIEPGLAAGTRLHAGVHLAEDRVGNCRLFAQALRRRWPRRACACALAKR